jgi:phytoene dehydrogenase-like protein
MTSYDAIVVGGGTNGLAAAGRLAKSGRNVLVLESADRPGGGACCHEIAPGFTASSVAHLLNMLDPRVERELELSRHGLSYAAKTIPTTALSARGDHLVLEGCYGASLGGSIQEKDRSAWEALRRKLLRFASVLRPLKDDAPPDLGATSAAERMKLARLALKVRMLGRDDMGELMRMILINVADVLEDELGDDRLKGAVAFDAVLGSRLGPRSPNTLMLLLNRLAAEAAGETAGLAIPKGGMGALPSAMAAAATHLGAEIRTGTRVGSIVIEDDSATGVVLADGKTIRCDTVLSAIDPQRTLLELAGPRHLDTESVRRARAIRSRGGAAKLNLALSAVPDFRGADPGTRLVIAPSIGAVETAFDAVKYGGFSPSPVMEVILPSAFEDGLAPPGRAVLSATVQYAPRALMGGWELGRAAFLERIMATLETYAPGIRRLVTASELLTPSDLEQQFGFAGGNWHHGELTVEQMLFMRPMLGAAQYATPIAGLYLAGAGSHPGGGVSGAAGWNAAGRVLAMEGRR